MGSFVPFFLQMSISKMSHEETQTYPFPKLYWLVLLIGILVVAYDNPYISGMYPKQPGFLFIAQMIKVIYYMKMMKNIEELDPSRKHAHS